MKRRRFDAGELVIAAARRRINPFGADSETTGSRTRPRIDPWAKPTFSATSPKRRRIDALHGQHAAIAGFAEAAQQPALRQVTAAQSCIMVLLGPSPTLGAQELAAMSAARALASDSCLIIAVSAASQEALSEAGADQCISWPQPTPSPGPFAATLAANGRSARAKIWIGIDDDDIADLIHRLAAKFDERSATRAVAARDGQVEWLSGDGQTLLTAACNFFTVSAQGRFSASPFRGPALAQKLTVAPLQQANWHVVDEQLDAVMLPPSEAQLVLAGGAGVSDWAALQAAARALNATIAGSRVACDTGQLPRCRQIGASGSSTAASVYVALGISGAPHHLQGIEACRTVVCINTDPHAPMMKRADISIMADADAVLRELVQRLTESQA